MGTGSVSREGRGGGYFVDAVFQGGEGKGWLGMALGGVDVADLLGLLENLMECVESLYCHHCSTAHINIIAALMISSSSEPAIQVGSSRCFIRLTSALNGSNLHGRFLNGSTCVPEVKIPTEGKNVGCLQVASL